MKHAAALIFTLVLAVPALAGGDSSDGHTHAATEPASVPMPTQANSPRAAAFSEEFEAVAVFADNTLTLYLDRFSSNAPVAGATVEIEGGGLNGKAAETTPGVYVIDAPALAPARHPLTISIEEGDNADLLSTMLDLSAPPDAGAHEHGWREWLLQGLIAVIAVTAVALLVIRQRKQRGH